MRGVDVGGSKIAYVDLARGIYAEHHFAKLPTRHHQLVAMQDWLSMFPNPNRVWVEAPILGSSLNAQTLIQIAQVTGLAQMQWPDTELVVPPKWKKAVVGKGNATKLEVASWLRRTDPELYQKISGSQDLVDASALAAYGRMHG